MPEEEGRGGSDGDQTREEFRKAATLEQAGTLKPNALTIVLTATHPEDRQLTPECCSQPPNGAKATKSRNLFCSQLDSLAY